jgi:hypothetical protein
MFKAVNVMTTKNTYNTPSDDHAKGNVVDQPSTSTNPPSSNPLQIYKPISDALLCPPKRLIRKVTFNPNVHASQNYNIVEDLAQIPCVVSSLKVL